MFFFEGLHTADEKLGDVANVTEAIYENDGKCSIIMKQTNK